MVKLPNWLHWGKKDQHNISLRDLILASSSSNSGVAVTWQTALQAVTALACARVIGEGLAQIPLKLHQELPGGGSLVMRTHPLHQLIGSEPNEFNTSYEWRETMALHLVFAGNAYTAIVRVNGKVVELLPLNPKDVTTKKEGMKVWYEVFMSDGRRVIIQKEDMLHIKGIAWESHMGLDGVRVASEAIGLAMATEEHGARLFGNGAQPGGILTTEANLTDPETRKALRDSWEATHQGLRNAGKTALMWGGLKWSSTTQQNDQAQFLETRAFQVEEVCRWARVMPIMVGHSDKSMTFASAEQIFLSHVIHTMGPWYARIEQALNKALLTKEEKRQGYYFRFNVSALMRGSHADRATYFSKALGAGGSPAWMTQDEVRALDELNPLGGDAAKLPVINNAPPAPPSDPAAAKSIESLELEVKQLATLLMAQQQKSAPIQPINVDARTTVNQAPAAPVTVNMPEQKAPDVSVNVESPTVTVHPPEVKVPDVTVNVPDQKAPVVNVDVQPADVNVHLPARKTETTVKRDDDGNILTATQIETDA